MNKQNAGFYNRFSFFYPLVDIFLKPQKTILFNEINSLPNGKLLEIGVGNGAHLQQYKKHHLTGIDTSAGMLNIARKNSRENTMLIEMNGEELLFDDQVFDFVVLSHVIAVVDDAEKLLHEVYRVLKPQGRLFILNHFTPDNWLKHIDLFFEPVAKRLHFKSHFRIQHFSSIKKFVLIKEVSTGIAGYFKILIYQK